MNIKKNFLFWLLSITYVEIKGLNSYPFYKDFNEVAARYNLKESGLTEEEELALYLYIIYKRSVINPTPVKLAMLEWSNGLAKLAKTWSEKCTSSFGPIECEDIISQNREFIDINQKFDKKKVLASWLNESHYYDYDKNTCKGSCDNYKRLFSDEPLFIGCGRSICSDKYFYICNFYPAIKDLNKRPYDTGYIPCEKCREYAEFSGKCARIQLCEIEPEMIPDENLCRSSISSSSSVITKSVEVLTKPALLSGATGYKIPLIMLCVTELVLLILN